MYSHVDVAVIIFTDPPHPVGSPAGGITRVPGSVAGEYSSSSSLIVILL